MGNSIFRRTEWKGWSCTIQRSQTTSNYQPALLWKAKHFTHARHMPYPSLSSSCKKGRDEKPDIFCFRVFFWRTLMYTFLRCQLLKLNQASWTSLKSSCCNLKYDSSVHQNRRDMVAASENRTATVPWDRTGFPHQNSLFGYLIQLQVADQLLKQHLWNLLLQDLLCFSIGRAVESSSIKATSWAVVWVQYRDSKICDKTFLSKQVRWNILMSLITSI